MDQNIQVDTDDTAAFPTCPTQSVKKRRKKKSTQKSIGKVHQSIKLKPLPSKSTAEDEIQPNLSKHEDRQYLQQLYRPVNSSCSSQKT